MIFSSDNLVIFLCHQITCLWFCNESFCNKKDVICGGPCIFCLPSQNHNNVGKMGFHSRMFSPTQQLLRLLWSRHCVRCNRETTDRQVDQLHLTQAEIKWLARTGTYNYETRSLSLTQPTSSTITPYNLEAAFISGFCFRRQDLKKNILVFLKMILSQKYMYSSENLAWKQLLLGNWLNSPVAKRAS